MKELDLEVIPFTSKADVTKYLSSLEEDIRSKVLAESGSDISVVELYKKEAEYVVEHYLPEIFWEKVFNIPAGIKPDSQEKINAMIERSGLPGLSIDMAKALLPDI
jgi:hypothetical protein